MGITHSGIEEAVLRQRRRMDQRQKMYKAILRWTEPATAMETETARRQQNAREEPMRWLLSLDPSFRSKGTIIAAERCCSKRINGAARDEARQGVYGVKQQRSHFCIFSDFHSHHNSTCLRRMRG